MPSNKVTTNQPYAIQAKHYDRSRHEEHTGTNEWNSWNREGYYDPEYWIVVRDKPKPQRLAIRITELQEIEHLSNNEVATKLIEEGYATEFPA